jgi:apolipoprotein N-acyltransferase
MRKIFKRPAIQAFLWGLAAALALPPVHLLPALLFAVPGLLRLLDRAPRWRDAALIGWAFGFGVALAGLYWVTEAILTMAAQFWWFVPFAAPLLAIAVAFYMIPPALAAWASPPGLPRVVVFAAVFVASNLLQQFAFSGFPWNLWGGDWAIPGKLGDIFMQPAALVGVHGLTLLTVLLATTPLFRARGLALGAAVLVVWAGFGIWRLEQPAPAAPGVTLVMVQPDEKVPTGWDRPARLARWQRLLQMTAAGLRSVAGTPGEKAVIWPESASPWFLDTDAAARQQLAAVAGDTPVIAGSIRFSSPTAPHNSMIVTEGAGPPVGIYDKWHLVPFGEYMPAWVPLNILPVAAADIGGFVPGPGPRTLHPPGLPPFGALICYEAIFTGQILDEADRPAWMVNITDDGWFGDSAGPRQHFAAARMRAVEEGLPLARDANSGISAVIDAKGRVLADLPLDVRGNLVASLPGALPPTLYARFGLWVPGVLDALALALGLGLTLVRRTRS